MRSNYSLGNTSLEKLLRNELKEAYWSERHLVKLLLKLRKSTANDELKTAIEQQHTRTEEQVNRLEEIFSMVGRKIKVKKSDAMKSLVKSAESLIEDTSEGSVTRDIAIIITSRKINHYGIGAYGGLLQLTNILGLSRVADVFSRIVLEKKQTEDLLAGITVSGIYLDASDVSEHDDDEDDAVEVENTHTESVDDLEGYEHRNDRDRLFDDLRDK